MVPEMVIWGGREGSKGREEEGPDSSYAARRLQRERSLGILL